MTILKLVNRVNGFLALVTGVIMCIAVYLIGTNSRTYYYIISGLFVAFAAVFLATGIVFVVRSMIRHIKNRKIGNLIRHYIYAYMGFYVLLMVLDHICMRSISWTHNLLYAFAAAFLQIYFNGLKLENIQKMPEEDDA